MDEKEFQAFLQEVIRIAEKNGINEKDISAILDEAVKNREKNLQEQELGKIQRLYGAPIDFGSIEALYGPPPDFGSYMMGSDGSNKQ